MLPHGGKSPVSWCIHIKYKFLTLPDVLNKNNHVLIITGRKSEKDVLPIHVPLVWGGQVPVGRMKHIPMDCNQKVQSGSHQLMNHKFEQPGY